MKRIRQTASDGLYLQSMRERFTSYYHSLGIQMACLFVISNLSVTLLKHVLMYVILYSPE